MLDSVRSFIAANIQVATMRKVALVQRSLRSSPGCPDEDVAWVPPPNLHLTLRFLGNIDPAVVPLLSAELEVIAAQQPVVVASLRALSAFPTPANARVLIVELDDNRGELSRLAHRCEELARSIGLAPETRAFHPHITLARLKTGTPVAGWIASIGETSFATSTLTELVLYESHRTAVGGEYRALSRVPLLGGQAGNASEHPLEPGSPL